MNYLKEKLEEKHISQSELARRLGVTRQYIWEIVNNKKNIKRMPLYKIVSIANILDIPLEEFIKEILKNE